MTLLDGEADTHGGADESTGNAELAPTAIRSDRLGKPLDGFGRTSRSFACGCDRFAWSLLPAGLEPQQ
jgi:hypothetical protein